MFKQCDVFHEVGPIGEQELCSVSAAKKPISVTLIGIYFVCIKNGVGIFPSQIKGQGNMMQL